MAWKQPQCHLPPIQRCCQSQYLPLGWSIYIPIEISRERVTDIGMITNSICLVAAPKLPSYCPYNRECIFIHIHAVAKSIAYTLLKSPAGWWKRIYHLLVAVLSKLGGWSNCHFVQKRPCTFTHQQEQNLGTEAGKWISWVSTAGAPAVGVWLPYLCFRS